MGSPKAEWIRFFGEGRWHLMSPESPVALCGSPGTRGPADRASWLGGDAERCPTCLWVLAGLQHLTEATPPAEDPDLDAPYTYVPEGITYQAMLSAQVAGLTDRLDRLEGRVSTTAELADQLDGPRLKSIEKDYKDLRREWHRFANDPEWGRLAKKVDQLVAAHTTSPGVVTHRPVPPTAGT